LLGPHIWVMGYRSVSGFGMPVLDVWVQGITARGLMNLRKGVKSDHCVMSCDWVCVSGVSR
jgi:hypothetical protein